jgi:protein arginine kinase activator
VKCQVCGEAEATIHFKELKLEEMHEMHLCPACAEEKGFHSMVEMEKSSLSSKLIFMAENLSGEGSAKIGQVQCPSCGMRYGEFARAGRLGCSECYGAFDVQLRRLLRRVHGSTRHIGKSPGRPRPISDRRAQLQRLQDDLQRAIVSEDYERAAQIRDAIRKLENAPAEEEPRL